MKGARLAAVAVFIAQALVASSAQRLPLLKSQPAVAIVGANVVNIRDGSVLSDATIVVRNGRIESVGRTDPAPNIPVINLKGHYVIPGLIDAHAHIADIEAGVRALESGATTIRSAGVSAYADVSLRELVKQSPLALPDVLAAGYGLRPELPVDAFVSSPEYWDLESGLRGTDRVTRAVRMNAGLANDPQRLLFSESEIQATVREATQRGIPVEAHAFGDQGAAAAIRAGVRSIEHGSYMSEATFAMMRERRAFLVPTLRILTVTPTSAPASVQSRVKETLPRARESIQTAHKLGVKVVAGTDSRYAIDTGRFVSHEIRELTSVGFSPLQALQSATIISAEMLHRETRIGAVEPRYEADLIGVAGNPLVDVNALANPLFIMTNGRIALNKVGPIP